MVIMENTAKTGKGFPVKSMSDLEKLGHSMKWQFFEKLVAFVFEQNDFKVSVSVVEKYGGSKRQYDVIAEGSRFVFAVDCKRWSGPRYKASMLREAADKQVERCLFLKNSVKRGVIPLLVTLMREDIVLHNGVPVVPIEMLNTFLNSYEGTALGIRII